MNNKKEQPWIDAGYAAFAKEGHNGLTIALLTKMVGKSKSSFYHYFADIEVFTSILLAYHLEIAKVVTEEIAACEVLDELITVFLARKEDILFNRQLRVHRENPEYEACFARINDMLIPALKPLFGRHFELTDHSYLAELFLTVVIDNLFLQLTEETLERAWLKGKINGMKTLVDQFKRAGQAT